MIKGAVFSGLANGIMCSINRSNRWSSWVLRWMGRADVGKEEPALQKSF